MDEEDVHALATLDALDERLFMTPSIALDQVEKVVCEMSDIALHNYDACVKQIFEFDPKRDRRIDERENLLDTMTDSANKYTVSLSSHVTREVDMLRQNYIVKSMICYERIGDLAVNIKDEVARMREEGTVFSGSALEELKIAFNAIYEILEITSEAFKNTDSAMAAKVEPLEEVIDDLVEDMNARHVYRMMNELCDPITGIRFQSILTNVEHISDKCSDIAVYILERDNHEIFGKEHSYLHELHVSNDEDYQTYYRNNYEKYFNALANIPTETPVEEKAAEIVKEKKPKKKKANA